MQAEMRELHQQVEAARDVVECAQRAIAHSRHSAVLAQCRVLQFASPAAAADPATLRRRVRAVAARIEQSHKRLLRLAAAVEGESDRLDVACAEIDRLPGQPGTGAWPLP